MHGMYNTWVGLSHCAAYRWLGWVKNGGHATTSEPESNRFPSTTTAQSTIKILAVGRGCQTLCVMRRQRKINCAHVKSGARNAMDADDVRATVSQVWHVRKNIRRRPSGDAGDRRKRHKSTARSHVGDRASDRRRRRWRPTSISSHHRHRQCHRHRVAYRHSPAPTPRLALAWLRYDNNLHENLSRCRLFLLSALSAVLKLN